MLNDQQKRKVLDIIVSWKGVIPYRKTNSIDSSNIKPENEIFVSKDEFNCTLKGSAVADDEYNSSKILYTLLEMRDLSDLNYLYNAQDAILHVRSWKIDLKICLTKRCTIIEHVIRLAN